MWNLLHVVIVAAVLLLLVRSAVAAWQNRRIALAVWRRIRLRHVLGSLGLVAVVVGVAVMVATLLPVTQFGLGSLVGVQGNAVFAPIETVLMQSPQAQAILASTVWHTTFNSILIATLLLTVALPLISQ